MYIVHTQSLKIRIEDESKSFFYVFNEIVVYVSWNHPTLKCWPTVALAEKSWKTTRRFFSVVCAYSEGGNEITCRRSKSKGKKNVRELGQDLQENVPFLRTKCIVGKKSRIFQELLS